MKKFYLLMFMSFNIAIGYGQIKVVDDSFKTDVAAISILNKPIDSQLEKLIPRHNPANQQITSSNSTWAENPVGEKFYVCEQSEQTYVRVNPSDSTVCLANLPVGYYEFTGIILTSDQLDEHRKKILQYRIAPQDRQSVKSFLTFDGNGGVASMVELKKMLNGVKPNNWTREGCFGSDDVYVMGTYVRPCFPMFICRNSEGQTFYLPYKRVVVDYTRDDREEYVMLPYYEEAQKMIGKEVALYGSRMIRDYISKEVVSIDNPYLCDILISSGFDDIELNPARKYCICKDIVLKDDKVLAIIEYEQGSFAVSLDLVWPKDIAPHGFQILPNGFLSKMNRLTIIPKYEIDKALEKYNSDKAQREQAAEIAAANSARIAAQLEAERMKELSLKYGADMAAKIIEGNVAIGMTMDMCLDAWGIPNDIFTTITDSGSAQVWLYNYKTRLYFYNNKLKVIQN